MRGGFTHLEQVVHDVVVGDAVGEHHRGPLRPVHTQRQPIRARLRARWRATTNEGIGGGTRHLDDVILRAFASIEG
eukprot:829695-Prorocentrum_minimum.AAC.1